MKTQAKTNIKYWLLAIALCLPINGAYAELDIPGISGVVGVEGSDGDLVPTTNITIDLSLAATGNWDSPGEGKGVYDPEKWAVVFKYNSIDIPAGKTVTFTNHPSGAPVVWLVSGDVNIAGAVNLNGKNAYTSSLKPTLPGPGGFAGGNGKANTYLSSSGFGPGGSVGRNSDSASYDTLGIGDQPGELYGNARIMPLIGGSGGSGSSTVSYTGGGGGGAILIASTQALIVNGEIRAQGGGRYSTSSGSSGYGSGGAVRVIADNIDGNGAIYANSTGNGNGYIRLETLNYIGSLSTLPPVPTNVPDEPLQLWPPDAAPSIRIVSIGAKTVPSDPSGSPQSGAFDFQLDNESSSDIILEARNVPTDATVNVRIIPVRGVSITETAVFSNGTDALSTWMVSDVALPAGGFVVQAHSINPIQ